MQVLIMALGGRYFNIRLGEATGWNPFQMEPSKGNVAFMTTTNPALVHHIVTVLDGLPVDNSGVHSCPAWSGLAFTMNLVARDKTTLATVSGNQAQCGGLALTVGGKPQPSVDDPGDVLLGQVASMLGTHLPAG